MSLSFAFEPFDQLASILDEQVLRFASDGLASLNQAAEELFGAKAQRLLGRKPADLLTPPPAPPPAGSPAMLAGRVLIAQQPGPLVEGTALGLPDGGQIWVIKGQLSLSEVGSLTAGLAHNLSGPLSVIRSTAEMMDVFFQQLLREHPEMGEAFTQWPVSSGEGCRKIVEQVDAVSGTVKDLLAKVRGEATSRRGPLDINEILKREAVFLFHDLRVKREVNLEYELQPGLPPVYGMYSDFSQSFRNILRNAIQAMRESPEKKLRISSRSLSREIVVELADSGVGIAPKDQKRIFEPFFTTRQRDGGGHGLGLYSVRQLLMPYRVRISVESRPGHTVFKVHIPVKEPSGG